MELKHFSHTHALAFHQVPQGSEIECCACKSPGSGNIYACWQCSYFLHDQCFRASRSLNHPSHPLHPLTLVPFPTYPSGSFFCNTCNHGGDGFSYSCSACEFDIHVHCALMPNPNPHVSPSILPTPNFNSQPQNPLYPPIQTSAFPSYPPQPQSQTTSYPPVPNSPLPNVINPAFPPNQHHPPPSYPQQNPTPPPQNFFPPPNIPTTITPPQPNPTMPTYSTVVNTTSTPPQLTPPKPSSMIKHFSHPHALKSMEIEEKTGKACSACEWEISGSIYSCTEPNCSFTLDKACFDAPRELRHKSHPLHSLTLTTNGPFDCYACWRSGKGLGYTCLTCSVTLHIDCVDWPETVPARGDAHKHALTLYYLASEGSGEEACDACEDLVNQKAWRYYCSECGVRVHTGCLSKWYNQSGGETQDDVHTQLFKLQQQQMLSNFRLQMAHQNAKFMTSLANSWKNF